VGIAPVRQSDRFVEFTAKARATILSASSGKERCNAFASHERENSFAASAYAATWCTSDMAQMRSADRIEDV
jgi:hypothetical protein